MVKAEDDDELLIMTKTVSEAAPDSADAAFVASYIRIAGRTCRARSIGSELEKEEEEDIMRLVVFAEMMLVLWLLLLLLLLLILYLIPTTPFILCPV